MTTKALPFLFIILVALASCNQGTKNGTADKNDTVRVSVLTFEAQADSLANKPVMIEGTVFHTCKHGGKRLFLIDGTDSIRVEVTTGPDIAKFDESLIGSRILVTGILKEERIDAKYLNEWEAEVNKPEETHETGIHSGAKGHEEDTKEDKLAQINNLRQQIKDSGKDHLLFYSIEAGKYTILK